MSNDEPTAGNELKRRVGMSLNVVVPPNAKLAELRAAPIAAPGSLPVVMEKIAAPSDDRQVVHDRIVDTLQTIYDPELPVNIFDLGLIYGIEVDAQLNVHLRMTLTAPACPMADVIVREVEAKVRATPGVSRAKVELVWSPPWDKSRMTEAAMLELGLL